MRRKLVAIARADRKKRFRNLGQPFSRKCASLPLEPPGRQITGHVRAVTIANGNAFSENRAVALLHAPFVAFQLPRVNAVKGTWQGDHTFVINLLGLGLGQPHEQWTLAFFGERSTSSSGFQRAAKLLSTARRVDELLLYPSEQPRGTFARNTTWAASGSNHQLNSPALPLTRYYLRYVQRWTLLRRPSIP